MKRALALGLALAPLATATQTLVELDAQLHALQAQRDQLLRSSGRPDVLVQSTPGTLPDFTTCDDQDSPPELLSWHLHVNFHANDPTNTSFALSLRDDFLAAFGLPADECPMGHLQPAPGYSTICPFPLEYDADGPYAGTGPFDLPNFSFFVPPALLHEVMTWWTQHRGTLSLLVHPNSGCQDNDHTQWPASIGQPTTMNAPHGLACCHSGPAGCTCYVTLYLGGNGLCVGGNADGRNVTLTACDEEDPNALVLWAETNFTDAFHQVEAFGWYPSADRCMAVTSCEVGAPLTMVDCLDESTANASLVAYNVGLGQLTADACDDLCVSVADGEGAAAVLAKCGKDGTALERRCAMAPHNTPVACPMEQY